MFLTSVMKLFSETSSFVSIETYCCPIPFLVVFSFFEKTTYCCRARRLSVRLSVRPSVRTIIVLLGGQLLVGPSLKWLATLKWLTT